MLTRRLRSHACPRIHQGQGLFEKDSQTYSPFGETQEASVLSTQNLPQPPSLAQISTFPPAQLSWPPVRAPLLDKLWIQQDKEDLQYCTGLYEGIVMRKCKSQISLMYRNVCVTMLFEMCFGIVLVICLLLFHRTDYFGFLVGWRCV